MSMYDVCSRFAGVRDREEAHYEDCQGAKCNARWTIEKEEWERKCAICHAPGCVECFLVCHSCKMAMCAVHIDGDHDMCLACMEKLRDEYTAILDREQGKVAA